MPGAKDPHSYFRLRTQHGISHITADQVKMLTKALSVACRELLGAGDGAESALMATSAGPAPFFGSPFLNLPAALADDAALFDFDMPAGDPQALKQPNEAMQAPQSAATQALPTMAADTMTLQPTDVLMAPFLDPVDLLMPQVCGYRSIVVRVSHERTALAQAAWIRMMSCARCLNKCS